MRWRGRSDRIKDWHVMTAAPIALMDRNDEQFTPQIEGGSSRELRFQIVTQSRSRAPREEKLSRRAYSSLAYVNFKLNWRILLKALAGNSCISLIKPDTCVTGEMCYILCCWDLIWKIGFSSQKHIFLAHSWREKKNCVNILIQIDLMLNRLGIMRNVSYVRNKFRSFKTGKYSKPRSSIFDEPTARPAWFIFEMGIKLFRVLRSPESYTISLDWRLGSVEQLTDN